MDNNIRITPLKSLIFDRKTIDIQNKTKKGYYNYNDLNRIEQWCNYLRQTLEQYAYTFYIDTRENWTMQDFPYESELERIKNNLFKIKEYYFSFTTPPSEMNHMTISKANDIEKMLYEIEQIITWMENTFVPCGVSGLGQNRIWQRRFRKTKIWNTQPYKFSEYLSTDTLSQIATNNGYIIKNKTNILQLKEINKRDDVYASIDGLNENFQNLDDLVGYECDYYELTNIIYDSSFELDRWDGRNISTTEYYNGTKSLYFPVGTTIVATINTERPVLNHKYYGRRYIKSSGNNEPADCRFELYAGDGDGLNWVFAWNRGNHPQWEFDSDIQEIVRINYDESTQTRIRCFNVNTTADTWVDGLMLIDLTESFGSGNEPTKEWCDAHIPYFTGLYILKVRRDNN